MIQIYINAQEGQIRVTGHAHYDEKGKDIVCAAVSSIVNGIYLYFYDIRKAEIALDNDFITELKYNEDGEQFYVEYDTQNITNIVVVSIFAKMFSQFKDEGYKDFVEFEYIEPEPRTDLH